MQKSRAALQGKQIEHVYHCNMADQDRTELAKIVGKTSVPQGFVNGIPIGGCNDGPKPWHGILPLLNSGKLEKALQVDDPAETEKILSQ